MSRSIDDAEVEAVLVATLETMPEGAIHWGSRAVAHRSGIAPSSVQHIWPASGLQPYSAETFKLSTDPLFVAKVRDIAGLYLTRPIMPWCCASTRRAKCRRLDTSNNLLIGRG